MLTALVWLFALLGWCCAGLGLIFTTLSIKIAAIRYRIEQALD